jgi:hypothetical protein
MTERVDLDRLADYIGGALDGTPDADAVRRLIDADPAWAGAYSDLLAADAAVSADLAGYAAAPAPMPGDVADRLDAFLRTLASEPVGEGPRAVRDRPVSTRTGPGRGQAGRSGPELAGPGRVATGRRRSRLLGVLSAAAAVIAVGFGLLWAAPEFRAPSGGGSDSAATQADRAAAPEAAPTRAGPAQLASGRDYRAGGFGSLTGAGAPRLSASAQGVAPGASNPAGGKATPSVGAEREGDAPPQAAEDTDGLRAAAPAGVPAELTRLAQPAPRQACLAAIMAIHGGTPAVLDYAHFAGEPALVVLLNGTRTGGARPWVVVAGPDCGVRTGFVDERYNGPAE